MTILIATDFSPCSQMAARLAAALARRLGAQLHLLHAFDPPHPELAALPSGSGWEREMLAAAEQQMAADLQKLKSTGVTVSGSVEMGSPAGVIVETARAVHADLIVVGTHGRKGLAHAYLGSVAERVVRTSVCPVLVTRQDIAGADRWDAPMPLRLTIVCDGASASRAGSFWVRTAGQAIAGSVSLVRVYWPPAEAAHYGLEEAWQGTEGHPDLVRLLERDLRHETEALSGARLPPVRFRVADREVAASLDSDARALGTDAMVFSVAKRPSGQLAHVNLASLLRSASVPTFCLPQTIQPAERRIPAVRSVLLACDLSDAARAAVLPAYGLLTGGGRVELCYVHEQMPARPSLGEPVGTALSPNERTAIEGRLRALVPAEAAEHGIATRISIAEAPQASQALLAAADRLDIDVIALGSHGRTGLRRALMGSVAEEVFRHSPRPTFIVHAPR
ncbi:MAG TPA: universal stress protein [Polyangia bacterium]|nr:universal stress protein [Polyangia bacterium]